MKNAVNLPVAVAGALMPDAHQGYGLPIGGVLATSNAVIPYAVGVDIACRMKMTVLALDSVDAGEGDTVLIVQEGWGASTAATGKAGAAIDSAIVGVVDRIDLLKD